MQVAIGAPPFKTRMVEVPTNETKTIDQMALRIIWNTLGESLAELGYRIEGVKMPPVKTFILRDREFVKFHDACADGDDMWRAYCRKCSVEEHGSCLSGEDSAGFVTHSGRGKYLICIKNGAITNTFCDTGYPAEFILGHELTHIWETKLKVKRPGELTERLEYTLIGLPSQARIGIKRYTYVNGRKPLGEKHAKRTRH